MKGKPLEMSLLFDFYGELLTPKQRDLFHLYYGEDFSLAEIAGLVGVSRQGVRDVIKRAENTLYEMEQRLGLVARYGGTARCTAALSDTIAQLRTLNETTLHHPTITTIIGQLETLVHQLQQEASDGI